MNKLLKDKRTYFMIVLFGMILWFAYLVIRYPIPPTKYILIGVVLIIIIVTLLFLSQYLSKNKMVQNIGKIIIVIISLLFLFINYFFSTTMEALLSNRYSLETDNVLVIVKVSSPYYYTQDLAGKIYGTLETQDDNIDKVLVKIEKENAEVISPQTYSSIISLVKALLNNEVDCMVINESYRSLIEDEYPSFFDETRIIYSHQYISQSTSPEERNLCEESFNIYITGIDTYGAISSKSRSDVNIILTVNPIRKTILLTSIPRDYYIPFGILNGKKDKLTHSGLYGVDETMQNVASYFQIDIDYFVRVNFDSVIEIIDALGGIEVDNPQAFGNFQKGNIHLNGEEALAFSRERYAFEQGDRERGKNQMRVITGMLDKMTSPAILKNYKSLLESLDETFQTNISDEQIIELIRMQLNDMSSWHVEKNSVDGTGEMLYSPIYGSRLYMMVPDEKSVAEAKEKILKLMQ